MLKKIGATIVSASITSGWLYTVYAALVLDSHNFQNLMSAIIVITFIGSLFILFSKNGIESIREGKKKNYIPSIVYTILGLVVVGALFYFGWFWFGGMKLITSIIMISRRHNLMEKE